MASEIKFFEVRDEGTTIPVSVMRTSYAIPEADPVLERERQILKRGGFYNHDYFFMTNLNTTQTCTDIYSWTGGRTMRCAHDIIIRSWHFLKSGDVVDVEFLMGETAAAKSSSL